MTTPKIETPGIRDLECGGLDNDGAQCANALWICSVFADGPYMICSDCGNSGKIVVQPVPCARCGQPVAAECAKRFVTEDGHAVVLHGEPDRPCYDMAVAGADLSACFDCWSGDEKDYGCAWETQGCACDCHADERPITPEMEESKHYPGDGCVEKESEGMTAMPQNCHHRSAQSDPMG